MKVPALAALAVSLCGCSLFGQPQSMSCDERNSADIRFCEIRETAVSAPGTLNVDAGANGGVTVRGAKRSDILVRAMVQARGVSDLEAKNTGAQVIVLTSAATVQASGPAEKNWSVSYEILVPAQTNLNLKVRNGGVAISGVESAVQFHVVNGGITLIDLGGNVRGDTENGGVQVTLKGERWNGQGLDVTTRNGGISMRVPDGYSAQLDVATVNGGLKVQTPNMQVRRNGRAAMVTLGSGGPLLRLRTLNGGIGITRVDGTA